MSLKGKHKHNEWAFKWVCKDVCVCMDVFMHTRICKEIVPTKCKIYSDEKKKKKRKWWSVFDDVYVKVIKDEYDRKWVEKDGQRLYVYI